MITFIFVSLVILVCCILIYDDPVYTLAKKNSGRYFGNIVCFNIHGIKINLIAKRKATRGTDRSFPSDPLFSIKIPLKNSIGFWGITEIDESVTFYKIMNRALGFDVSASIDYQGRKFNVFGEGPIPDLLQRNLPQIIELYDQVRDPYFRNGMISCSQGYSFSGGIPKYGWNLEISNTPESVVIDPHKCLEAAFVLVKKLETEFNLLSV